MSLRLRGLYFCLLALVVLISRPAHATYQDEAYNVDFAHTLFGNPIKSNTFFHRPNAASRASLLYTLGEKGVVGAVNPKDGEIVWRVLVNDSVSSGQGHGQGILRAHEASTTVVSGFGSTVRAWDAKDGRLVWEWTGKERVKSLELLSVDASNCDVVVLTEGERAGGSVYRLSGDSGKVHWQQNAPSADHPLAVSASATGLYLLTLNPASRSGYKIRVQTLTAADGKEKSQYTLSSESEVTSEASILHVSSLASAPIVAWTDDKKKNVHFNVLGSKHSTMAMINPYGTHSFTGIHVVEPSMGGATPHFLVHYDRADGQQVDIFHVDTKAGKANKAHAIPREAQISTFSAVSTGSEVYFVEHSESETAVYSSTSPNSLERYPVKHLAAIAGSTSPVYSISELASKGAGRFSVRTAAFNGDGDWQLYQNGEFAWTRYEGLAGVVAAAFVAIPSSESLIDALAAESHSNIVSAYIHRVTRHINDLKGLPAWLQSVPSRFIESLTGIELGASENPVEYDSFGFKKIIIVATEKGRVAALGSGNRGQVLWSWRAADSTENQSWNVQRVDVQGSNVHILAEGGELLILDGITGKVIKHKQSTQGVDYYVPIVGPGGQPSLLGVSQDGTPGVLPDGFSTSAHIVTQAADGTVIGWRTMPNGKSRLAWNFSPKVGEKVRSVTTRPAHDPVASIGRARGDRNVLYKYLSPNLALVTATDADQFKLSVYLLDTISGQVLYTTTHEHVDVSLITPAVFSENWLAYSIFTDVPSSAPADGAKSTANVQGYQLVVSELFESPLPNDRGPLGSAANYSSLTSVYPPHVESAAYVVSSYLTSLSTTNTLQGITPRSLLAYSPMLAALVAIPVHVLSPRRPVDRDPTQSEREEMLMRYQAHLDLHPQWYLSHERELLGIQSVISSPTNMESSSLVFAYGDVDVFGTRVSPIGTFDLLGKGFGKLQLVLTVLALAAGTTFLAPMARRKTIDGLWGG